MTISTDSLDHVHLFWFGELADPTAPIGDRQKVWFAQDDVFDASIRDQFGALIAPAAEADWDVATLSRTQQMGLVVLLDQFPRNIYRSSGDAFAYDRRAREIADSLLALGIDRYHLVERFFLFLPAMHSEDVGDQDRCVMLYAEQALSVPVDWKDPFRNGLDFATKHRDLIRKFGRFPHRNQMLGRQTTEEEAAFLAEHGRGF